MNVIKNYYNTYLPTDKVPRLKTDDFSSCGSLNPQKFKSADYSIVLFYVPECRFCQEFSVEFTKFQVNYAKSLGCVTAACDLSQSDNIPLVQKSRNFPYSLGNVFPTIIVYYKGKPCSSYTNSRSAEALKSYIENNKSDECMFKFTPCD